ncbi:hypothetical protein [Acanthopleuribacter pedis]|uniref:Uncharacterized protein n=1 Tax=Acanthopleuribacter pedis TaxID=442870 RepID=A0A8J7U357_9BACT|nr:hypothetical protein [Acanthopleuribacter pedis]MBO1317983.1 hypothetical protein [Acanthopleuribacter pedis]
MTKKEIYIQLLRSLLPAARNLLAHLNRGSVFQAKKNKAIAQDVFDILRFTHHIPHLLLCEKDQITKSDLRFLSWQCDEFLASEVSKSAYGEEPSRLIQELQALADAHPETSQGCTVL